MRHGDKWGYVGHNGEIVIAAVYEDAADFHEGLAAVRQDGRPFFIDQTGQSPFRVPTTITEIGDFAAGLAPVKKGEKWGFIDKTGMLVIDPLYDAAETLP